MKRGRSRSLPFVLFFAVSTTTRMGVCFGLSSSLSTRTLSTRATTTQPTWTRFEPSTWRAAAKAHHDRVYGLLRDGLVKDSGRLNKFHPVYNFLIEYYGIKGAKGVRRLARYPIGTSAVVLEGTNEDDFANTLHLKHAHVLETNDGVVYDPSLVQGVDTSALEWYQSILRQTLHAEPVWYCFNLHEWAMQYWPKGAQQPPSSKYQNHLPLRVSQDTINQTVERRGTQCTHVDALRFFAPAAASYNAQGASLQRTDQLRLEQPGCVHAHMDLLKLCLRLTPFCDSDLLYDVLEMALEARRLDVAASPYDASAYGVAAIPVETAAGRDEFKRRQIQLMKQSQPIRQRLLENYDTLLEHWAPLSPKPERYAVCEPGGLPWRKNLVADKD